MAQAIQAQEANFNTAGRWATMFGERSSDFSVRSLEGSMAVVGWQVIDDDGHDAGGNDEDIVLKICIKIIYCNRLMLSNLIFFFTCTVAVQLTLAYLKITSKAATKHRLHPRCNTMV